MQQLYRRTPMPKSDFNKVALQLYRNRTSAWMFSCKFATYFQNTLPKKSSEGLVLIWFMTNFENSWYPDKIFCHQVTKTKCALNLNLFIENAFKRCLTQYVWMKHQLDPRYVWDKNMKKNLLFTVFRISHFFWKYLAGHVHAFPMAQFSYSMLCKKI